MKMEPIKRSETSAISTQTPGRYPKENALHIKHGESLKSRIKNYIKNFSGKRFENREHWVVRGGNGKMILGRKWEVLRMEGRCTRIWIASSQSLVLEESNFNFVHAICYTSYWHEARLNFNLELHTCPANSVNELIPWMYEGKSFLRS